MEEQKQDEPKQDEPKQYEPKQDEPKQDEPKPSIELPKPTKIQLGYSKVHFRGVFATEDIESEELIERCPMVPLDFRTKYHKDTQLYNYLYTHKCPCDDCKKHGSIFLMVLGYGMLYNHQDTPNTVWNFNYKEKVADVVATMPIKKGEEIFVSYGAQYFNNKNKVTLEGNDCKHFSIQEDEGMPIEWRNWIKENITRGVATSQIKEILYKNNFDESLVKNVFKEEGGE